MDYTVLTGDEETLTGSWYVVNKPALISHSGLMVKGGVRIILCDDCVWSIEDSLISVVYEQFSKDNVIMCINKKPLVGNVLLVVKYIDLHVI